MFNRGNRILIDAAIVAMGLKRGDSALDIGFGGGYSLPALINAVPGGNVTAIDISDEMLAAAERRYRREIDAGTLEIRKASVDAIGDEAETFEAAMSCNTFYFWPEIDAGLREVRRVLKPGGRFVLGNRTKEVLRKFGFEESKHNLLEDDEISKALTSAGFESVEIADPSDRIESRLFVATKG